MVLFLGRALCLASDLGLHCLPASLLRDVRLKWVMLTIKMESLVCVYVCLYVNYQLNNRLTKIGTSFKGNNLIPVGLLLKESFVLKANTVFPLRIADAWEVWKRHLREFFQGYSWMCVK